MAQYPTIYAGQRLTATLLRSMMPRFVLKAADTNRASTTTLSADPELVTETLEAGSTYYLEFMLGVSALAAADIKIDWDVPAGSTGFRYADGPGSTALDASADNILMRAGVHAFTSSIVTNGVRDNANQFRITERGYVVVGATAGAVSLRWAQNTSNVTASRVAAGSLLRYWRLA